MSAMKGLRKSKVRHGNSGHIPLGLKLFTAVTLDGTVIHKSGLITGGQGAGGGRKFDDKEVEGCFFSLFVCSRFSLNKSN